MATDKIVELRSLLSQISDLGGNVFSKPCEDPKIVDWVEESLKLRFPESLRRFFSVFNYLEIRNNEFACVEELGDFSRKWQPRCSVPQNYVPVLDDGAGGCWFVVCAKRKVAKDPEDFGRVFFSSGPSNLEFECADFLDFVLDKAMKYIEHLERSKPKSV